MNLFVLALSGMGLGLLAWCIGAVTAVVGIRGESGVIAATGVVIGILSQLTLWGSGILFIVAIVVAALRSAGVL